MEEKKKKKKKKKNPAWTLGAGMDIESSISPLTLERTSPNSPSVDGALSFAGTTPLLSVRVQVRAPGCSEALVATSLLKSVSPAHAPSCHADAIGQVSKG
ncbi:hypothetical protein F2P81_024109 [Scophthalmus maximus]|uniref:Uncharacterized protein n=1 Tax=Scophthalmus maximus TaxID=52904 RepID=A0A6A4RT50_SCOMX|nr:hypothetical protein F2P81_024109 [Scophthalmus maximus]